MAQRRCCFGWFIAALTILWGVGEVSAQHDEKAAADFYRGKQIRIIIGSGPGGTYDIYSRLLSKHMGRFIPGHPAMLVQSRAGAGGLIAANTIYNTEPRDGTVIGSFGETFPLRQAMGAPAIQFDSAKYQWIGSAINTAIACVARSDSAVASFMDIVDGKSFTVGTMAPGSTIYDTPAILNAAFNLQMKLVRGFDGVANIVNAAEAKEVDGYCASWLAMLTTGRHLQLFDAGVMKPILIMGDRTPDHPRLKQVPAAEALAKTMKRGSYCAPCMRRRRSPTPTSSIRRCQRSAPRRCAGGFRRPSLTASFLPTQRRAASSSPPAAANKLPRWCGRS